MRLPNNTDITLSITCGECNAAIEVDAPINNTRDAANKLRNLAENRGWEPLMLGKKCVNLLCPKCVKEALSDETEDMDAEGESDEQTVSEEIGQEAA